MWKDFFYFSRNEKKGIIVLSILIVVALIVRFTPDWLYKPQSSIKYRNNTDSMENLYAQFLAGIKENTTGGYRESKKDVRQQSASIHLTAFDPNTADSATFIQLGLPGWMAGNIIRYRNKGGKFRKPEDFRKIYGVTDELYATVAPFISINTEKDSQKRDFITAIEVSNDSVYTPKTIKYPAGTVINLNDADTTELKMIPGIGSVTARRITSYRAKLGGFYTTAQLNDLNLDTTHLAQWFTTEGHTISRINLNKVSVDRLRNHPYFNFYQAKAIVELRKRKGSFTGLEALSLLEEFTVKDFERMKHYVCFE